jgi:hypothetical protein
LQIKTMFKKIFRFFDTFEESIRTHLSRHPILYTFIGGIAIVLFWRGVWHTADIIQGYGGIWGFLFYEPVNLVISVIVLLGTGLFVSYFIGDNILISGLRREKNLYKKTEKEIRENEVTLSDIKHEVDEIKEEMDDIEWKLRK